MFEAKVRRTHARCLCGWKWPVRESLHESLMNYPVHCGKEGCQKTAYVIKHEDEIRWIRIRNFFVWIEENGSLLRMVRWPHGYEEEFVFFMTGVTFLFAYLLSLPLPCWLPGILLILLTERIFEITFVMISVSFVSRWQRDTLRTLFLWLLNYIQIIAIFGCFYWYFYAKDFKRPLESIWDSIYFSLVTITSLGDATISPATGIPKMLIGIEILLGLVLVAAILNLLIGTTLKIPSPKEALTPSELATKSKDLGKKVMEPTGSEKKEPS